MNLIRGLPPDFQPFAKGTVATIGNFDGVHAGHLSMLQQLKDKSITLGLPLVVVLFEPQPGEYFCEPAPKPRLSSLREKLAALTCAGVDYVCCLRFNKQFAQISSVDFANNLLSCLQLKYLLVGEDFRFGYQREGDVSRLRQITTEHGCELQVFSDFLYKTKRISSTIIREALQAGNLSLANTLLGRPYKLCGRVVRGAGRGQQWGIPTVNIHLGRRMPALVGVFCVQVQGPGILVNGVANLGTRPTVDGSRFVLEVHLLNWDNDLYGTLLQVFFLQKLRPEMKFDTIDALLSQIHTDISAAKAVFHQRELIDLAE